MTYVLNEILDIVKNGNDVDSTCGVVSKGNKLNIKFEIYFTKFYKYYCRWK